MKFRDYILEREEDEEKEDVMECPECGEEISNDSKKCPECGADLEEEEDK